jgi:hypothetical protein
MKALRKYSWYQTTESAFQANAHKLKDDYMKYPSAQLGERHVERVREVVGVIHSLGPRVNFESKA